ncbi:MAG: hypothetical protein LBP39_00495 [Rickettsiales bacterium]|jgi:uncharacterized protein YacL|nr:hypothetical protein [Rickettsiales bacterium]
MEKNRDNGVNLGFGLDFYDGIIGIFGVLLVLDILRCITFSSVNFIYFVVIRVILIFFAISCCLLRRRSEIYRNKSEKIKKLEVKIGKNKEYAKKLKLYFQ